MIIRCASALHVRPAGAGELSQRKAERRRGWSRRAAARDASASGLCEPFGKRRQRRHGGKPLLRASKRERRADHRHWVLQHVRRSGAGV